MKVNGIVRWFNNENGYGFIEYQNIDVFVHYTSILCNEYKSLIKGEIVEFELVKTKNGYAAKNVQSLDKPD